MPPSDRSTAFDPTRSSRVILGLRHDVHNSDPIQSRRASAERDNRRPSGRSDSNASRPADPAIGSAAELSRPNRPISPSPSPRQRASETPLSPRVTTSYRANSPPLPPSQGPQRVVDATASILGLSLPSSTPARSQVATPDILRIATDTVLPSSTLAESRSNTPDGRQQRASSRVSQQRRVATPDQAQQVQPTLHQLRGSPTISTTNNIEDVVSQRGSPHSERGRTSPDRTRDAPVGSTGISRRGSGHGSDLSATSALGRIAARPPPSRRAGSNGAHSRRSSIASAEESIVGNVVPVLPLETGVPLPHVPRSQPVSSANHTITPTIVQTGLQQGWSFNNVPVSTVSQASSQRCSVQGVSSPAIAIDTSRHSSVAAANDSAPVGSAANISRHNEILAGSTSAPSVAAPVAAAGESEVAGYVELPEFENRRRSSSASRHSRTLSQRPTSHPSPTRPHSRRRFADVAGIVESPSRMQAMIDRGTNTSPRSRSTSNTTQNIAQSSVPTDAETPFRDTAGFWNLAASQLSSSSAGLAMPSTNENPNAAIPPMSRKSSLRSSAVNEQQTYIPIAANNDPYQGNMRAPGAIPPGSRYIISNRVPVNVDTAAADPGAASRRPSTSGTFVSAQSQPEDEHRPFLRLI